MSFLSSLAHNPIKAVTQSFNKFESTRFGQIISPVGTLLNKENRNKFLLNSPQAKFSSSKYGRIITIAAVVVAGAFTAGTVYAAYAAAIIAASKAADQALLAAHQSAEAQKASDDAQAKLQALVANPPEGYVSAANASIALAGISAAVIIACIIYFARRK